MVSICISLMTIYLDHLFMCLLAIKGLPDGSVGKESACNAGDLGLISGSGRSPLQYPCLENSMDRGASGLQSIGLQRAGHN